MGSFLRSDGQWAAELYAVSPAGTVLASAPAGLHTSAGGPWTPMSSVSLGPDGTIYVGDEQPSDNSGLGIDKFDPVDLSSRGFVATANAEVTSTVVVDAANNVYAADQGGTIYAYRTSGVTWQKTLSQSIDTTPALTADGYLWVVAADGILHAFDAATGLQPATLTLGSAGTMTASSPVIGSDGTVYVAYNTTVFGVGGYGPPAAAFWQSFRGNTANRADVRNNRWTASAVSSVTVTPIQFNSTPSYAYGINGAGSVIGYGTDTTYGTTALVADPPAYTPDAFGYIQFGKTPSYGQAIDTLHDVIGYYLDSGYYQGFYFDYSGVSPAVTLSSFNTVNYPVAYAYAISPDGNRVMGMSATAAGADEATKWDTSNPSSITASDFGALGGNSVAYGVNNSGRVVGAVQVSGVYHAFFSAFAGTIQSSDDLGSQAGASGTSTAYAINGFNQLAGKTLTTAGVNRPFYKNYSMAVQTPETTWRLPSPMPTSINGDDGAVLGVNARGQMVGTANTGTGSTTYHAFIWTPSNSQFGIKDLNSLLSPTQQSQWVLSGATGINEAGVIVGYGTYNGQITAFVLQPN